MPKYKATDYEPVPPGLYTAKLEVRMRASSRIALSSPLSPVSPEIGTYPPSGLRNETARLERPRKHCAQLGAGASPKKW
jgi:hypothetical protein